MNRLKIWWYQRAMVGASIELEVARHRVIDINSRIGFYERKLNTLRRCELR